ncbi:MAG: hypothetical protein H8E36_16210 [Rhodospirillaceae bacterium]|nr:hypothetical protein [Rhodospirillaceae bacterium]
MSETTETFWDILSEKEALFSRAILDELAAQPWAQQLIKDITDNGGLTRTNKSRLFELRYAYSLSQAGIVPSYEIPGEGNSTLDFGFTCEAQNWAVELMRLEETEAVQNATQMWVDGDGVTQAELHLYTDADDPRHSTEGETIKAVERICQKCELNGHPYKFPVPVGKYHALLVDVRTFLDGCDSEDFIHVGLSGDYVNNEFCRLRWNGELISGVFNERTNLHGAEYARERVHFIGFVDEKDYCPGAFADATQFVANPQLFAGPGEALAAIVTWPLQPAIVL